MAAREYFPAVPATARIFRCQAVAGIGCSGDRTEVNRIAPV
jgi:hypothetical protein